MSKRNCQTDADADLVYKFYLLIQEMWWIQTVNPTDRTDQYAPFHFWWGHTVIQMECCLIWFIHETPKMAYKHRNFSEKKSCKRMLKKVAQLQDNFRGSHASVVLRVLWFIIWEIRARLVQTPHHSTLQF